MPEHNVTAWKGRTHGAVDASMVYCRCGAEFISWVNLGEAMNEWAEHREREAIARVLVPPSRHPDGRQTAMEVTPMDEALRVAQ